MPSRVAGLAGSELQSESGACGCESNAPTRRRFQVTAIYAIWGGILVSFSSLLGYLFGAPKPKPESEWVDAGDIASLAPGAPVEIAFHQTRVDGWKLVSEKNTAWAVKTPAGVTAFGPRCTHLGCAYHWDSGKDQFVCPCHSSLFSIQGTVLAGPAPRPLDRYDVRVEGGRLMIGRLRSSEGPSA